MGRAPCAAQETTPSPPVGTIAGTVVDKKSREPIIEAGVEVVGAGKTVRTDLDGRFAVKLPPGRYELRIFAPSYQAVRVQNLDVKAGSATKADAALAASGAAGVDVVEVVARRKRAAETTQIQERKEAAVVMDTISRETMAKSTGSEASDVVERAPAVTVKDDRFVFVRGLSERYTSALLNGSRLPSPDPLRRAVPLDLFPNDFLDSIGIIKTFSPDLPGDFSGGLIALNLRDLPDELTYSVGLSIGGNTQSTFQDFLTYKSTRADYFAAGVDDRTLPIGRLPPPTFDRQLTPEQIAKRQAREYSVGRQFTNAWSAETDDAPPNFGANFSIGNTWGPFGFRFAALYSNEWTTHRDEIQRQFGPGQPDPDNPGDVEPRVVEDLRADRGFFQSKLGGLLTLAYAPSEHHEISVRSFVYQNAVDETTTRTGRIEDPNEDVRTTLLRYTHESLGYGQLAGRHDILDWLHLDWRTALARTLRDEPDTRTSQYFRPPGTNEPFMFSFAGQNGGFRFENSTHEWLSDSMVDLTIPFDTYLPFTDAWRDLPGKLKFGPAYAYRERDFAQREFQYRPVGGAVDLTKPPEVILAPGNLTPDIVNFAEETRLDDGFTASQEIYAGYGLVELPIIRDRLRINGGARVERSLIRLDTGLVDSELCPGAGQTTCVTQFEKNDVDVLPGVNLVFSPLADMNFRLSWGKSVARPEFRELAPATFPRIIGEIQRIGNPALVETPITSYDARWEWFFTPLELVSAGFFYKQLDGPIEPVLTIVGNDEVQTWVNGEDGAELMGVELEARKNFGFLHERLRPLSLITNVTWSDSEVRIPVQEVNGSTTVQTSTARRLAGQSPVIVNAALDYSLPDGITARLLYYTAERSLFASGGLELPDIFFERRDQLDAVLIAPLEKWTGLPLTARLSVENILNAPFVYTQGDSIERKYTSGVKFTFGVTWTH